MKQLILLFVVVAIAGTMWGIGGQQIASAHGGGHQGGCSDFGELIQSAARDTDGQPGIGNVFISIAQNGDQKIFVDFLHQVTCD